MIFKYWFEMPDHWTFNMPKLRKFILSFTKNSRKILVPFAGEYRFQDNTLSMKKQYIYNDIDVEKKTDHHVDACLLHTLYPEEYFDAIIADPPYTHYQALTTYKNKKLQRISLWRNTASRLLKQGGIYIELGYNSTGIKDFKKIGLGICNNGGSHNDILIIVQKKITQEVLLI